VLILDEPTAALAVMEVEAVLDLITKLRDQGVTVILITHRLQDLFHVCDRIAVIRDGIVAAERRIGDTNIGNRRPDRGRAFPCPFRTLGSPICPNGMRRQTGLHRVVLLLERQPGLASCGVLLQPL
jgi:energy-coupling factor transporter ATP-binding protein EcfA2